MVIIATVVDFTYGDSMRVIRGDRGGGDHAREVAAGRGAGWYI